MSEKISVEQYREMMSKPTKSKSKFGAVKTVVDGQKFDSKHESERYGILKLRRRAGEITALQTQITFDLGEKTYIADFLYLDRLTMTWIVEDAKGVKTPEYIHKRKLMKKIYGIVIVET